LKLSEVVVASKGERLYLDTMVIVAYFHKGHRLHTNAEKLITNIEKVKYEGVISSLTLMEFIKVLRDAYVEDNRMNIAENEKEIRSKINYLYRINNLCFVEGRPPEFDAMEEVKSVYFNAVSQKAFEILCTNCGSVIKNMNEEFEHEGVHAMDALHLALAKVLNCDKIVTDENAFREVKAGLEVLMLNSANSFF
jgi:predicted nucleic acid-binding protein